MNKNENISSKKLKICKSIIILGYSGTGKTNIIKRYTKNRFDDNHIETIGVDYFSKEVNSQYGDVTLSIWDTCEKEIDLRIVPSNIYKSASAFIIVCSYDIIESFESLKLSITHVQNIINNSNRPQNITSNHLLPVIILINKSDLKRERKFKISDITKIIDQYILNIVIYEISAKDNNKINYVFERIIGLILGMVSAQNETRVVSTIIEDARNNSIVEIVESLSNKKNSFKLNSSLSVNKDRTGNCKSCCN